MYDRLYLERRELKPKFEEGVQGFITWAFAEKYCRSEGPVRCPCLKCECRPIICDLEEVDRHLKRRGFIENYWVWTYNREELSSNVPETSVNVTYDEPGDFDGDELPNKEAQRFYQLLNEMNALLFEGSLDSKLSMCARVSVAKSNWNVPD
ncbi:hypothetical protein KIW84_064381 [Lathyrus oleraceus]|uniref:Transposase-associated domain-containing protein n=1 Tax=Pisum sativum TaxID=3888 RepID=A0A9D5A8N0_PEA|nr:hypothetical protein KIW84_064381 [Pisum sativum]